MIKRLKGVRRSPLLKKNRTTKTHYPIRAEEGIEWTKKNTLFFFNLG